MHYIFLARTAFMRIGWTLLLTFLLGGSALSLTHSSRQLRKFTRPIEFDFIPWTVEALEAKFEQLGLGAIEYLNEEQRKELVLEALQLIDQTGRLEAELQSIYADPSISHPDEASRAKAEELAILKKELDQKAPLAEAILQDNIALTLNALGLGAAGGVFPPVAFHFSQLPRALIVSPRNEIRQQANVQLEPEIELEDQIVLENRVEEALDVSALVVNVGGLSTYPTMVLQNSSLVWVTETVVHEWVHNYLAFRPLGWYYSTTPEMRTVNETVASILGREIGLLVLEQYYPSQVPHPPPSSSAPSSNQEPPAFDFMEEMRKTRVRVDELLAQGEIDQAEAYMQARRQDFWEQGYRHIRRLNQAYFAFYGTYAAEAGGPAGEDPVGAAVRALWARIQDPAEFLRRVSGVNSFPELQSILGG
jgi:hypothetical protein